MEPLLEGHHWDSSNCPHKRGVLISGVVMYINVIIGTLESVLIREVSLIQSVLLRGVPLYSDSQRVVTVLS